MKVGGCSEPFFIKPLEIKSQPLSTEQALQILDKNGATNLLWEQNPISYLVSKILSLNGLIPVFFSYGKACATDEYWNSAVNEFLEVVRNKNGNEKKVLKEVASVALERFIYAADFDKNTSRSALKKSVQTISKVAWLAVIRKPFNEQEKSRLDKRYGSVRFASFMRKELDTIELRPLLRGGVSSYHSRVMAFGRLITKTDLLSKALRR